MGITPEMKPLEVAYMPGVKDLPLKVRVKFAKALVLEAEGKTDEANQCLEEAIELESNPE